MSIESLTGLITGGIGAVAVMAIFLALILSGRLHTDDEFQREVKAREKEQEAHSETRKALVEASGRADAAVRAAEMVAEAFSTGKRP